MKNEMWHLFEIIIRVWKWLYVTQNNVEYIFLSLSKKLLNVCTTLKVIRGIWKNHLKYNKLISNNRAILEYLKGNSRNFCIDWVFWKFG